MQVYAVCRWTGTINRYLIQDGTVRYELLRHARKRLEFSQSALIENEAHPVRVTALGHDGLADYDRHGKENTLDSTRRQL